MSADRDAQVEGTWATDKTHHGDTEGTEEMAVYVDQLRPVEYPWAGLVAADRRACHLMADTEEELEEFCRRLHLKASWRHGDHYDLTESKRRQAIRLGAVEVDATKLIQLRRRNRAGS